jgi:CO/xanthine dehydrogenase Mo-binding subunit
MNGIVNTFAATGVAASAIPCVSVSRGGLMQGTGLSTSIASVFGAELQAPKHVIETDKPQRSWHPTFANVGAFAADAGIKPAYLQAARLRQADPATVIRSRHRSRLR